MADEQNGVQRSISKIKQWIGWSWTYLWGFWFLLVIFLLYVLRTPLRLKENLNLGESLFIVNFRKKAIVRIFSYFFLYLNPKNDYFVICEILVIPKNRSSL